MNKFQYQRIAITTRWRNLTRLLHVIVLSELLTLGVNDSNDENNSKMKGDNKTDSEVIM